MMSDKLDFKTSVLLKIMGEFHNDSQGIQAKLTAYIQ